MNNKLTLMVRAAVAGLLLAVSASLLGAGPSGATETYSYSYSYSKVASTWTFDDQPAFTELATARIARVGITPIPIP